MGGGASKDPNGSKDRKISIVLANHAKKANVTFKILLLGAAECGKSTVMKQMKILNCGGFTKKEMKHFKFVTRSNTLVAIQNLIEAARDREVQFRGAALIESEEAQRLLVTPSHFDDDPEEAVVDMSTIGDNIATLWADESVKACFEHVKDQLDSARYFLDKASVVFKSDYEPTDQDAVRSRYITKGIEETHFEKGNLLFRIFDVGGQRGERKKWMKVFGDVNAIMFITSLSEYNQNLSLAEDGNANRMVESLGLFKRIACMSVFKKTTFFLFLNKEDIFREKIATIPLGDYFKDYKGGFDYDAGLAYVTGKYNRRKPSDSSCFVHVTNATSTQNVQFVWDAAKHTITESKLDNTGMV